MIYEATNADIPIIQHIVKEVWPVTYGKILSEEQITYMLGLIYSNEALLKQMNENHKFYILKEFDEPTGFIDIQKIDSNKSKLHKIYLLTKFQGSGYGKILMQLAFDKALEYRTPILQLNVNRYNPALDFYRKFGFEIVDEVDIPIGNNFFMNDYVMKKILY